MLSKLYNISAVYPFYNYSKVSSTDRQVAGCFACCHIEIEVGHGAVTDVQQPITIVLQRTDASKAVFKVSGGSYVNPWYITWSTNGSSSGTYLHSCYIELTAALPSYTGSSLVLLNQCVTYRSLGVQICAFTSETVTENGDISDADLWETHADDYVTGFCDGYNCQVSLADAYMNIQARAGLGLGKPSLSDIWQSDALTQQQTQNVSDSTPYGVRSINMSSGDVIIESLGDVTQQLAVLQTGNDVTATITLKCSSEQ